MSQYQVRWSLRQSILKSCKIPVQRRWSIYRFVHFSEFVSIATIDKYPRFFWPIEKLGLFQTLEAFLPKTLIEQWRCLLWIWKVCNSTIQTTRQIFLHPKLATNFNCLVFMRRASNWTEEDKFSSTRKHTASKRSRCCNSLQCSKTYASTGGLPFYFSDVEFTGTTETTSVYTPAITAKFVSTESPWNHKPKHKPLVSRYSLHQKPEKVHFVFVVDKICSPSKTFPINWRAPQEQLIVPAILLLQWKFGYKNSMSWENLFSIWRKLALFDQIDCMFCPITLNLMG